MRIIAIIEQEQIVKKILKHVGLWVFDRELSRTEAKKRPPPKANAPPGLSVIDYDDIQYSDENYCDPDYPFEAYLN